MSSAKTCTKDHSDNLPRARIEALTDSQRHFWRHKCAGCAYEMGRGDAGTAEANLRKRVQELQATVDALTAEMKKHGVASK